MSWMFGGATDFNGDLSRWSDSFIENMYEMFFGATTFNCDLSCWDVSTVADLRRIFIGATVFKGDLSRWNISSITELSEMLSGATDFNGDLSSWEVPMFEILLRCFTMLNGLTKTCVVGMKHFLMLLLMISFGGVAVLSKRIPRVPTNNTDFA
jgi:hypothetical protein